MASSDLDLRIPQTALAFWYFKAPVRIDKLGVRVGEKDILADFHLKGPRAGNATMRIEAAPNQKAIIEFYESEIKRGSITADSSGVKIDNFSLASITSIGINEATPSRALHITSLGTSNIQGRFEAAAGQKSGIEFYTDTTLRGYIQGDATTFSFYQEDNDVNTAFHLTQTGNWGFGATTGAQAGDGVRVIVLRAATTNPPNTPSAGYGVLYIDSATDALKFKGSGGTVTTLALA